MKSITEKVLLKLPIFLQNLAITIYGAKIQYLRYRKYYKYLLHDSNLRLFMSKKALEEYCNVALNKIIRDAVKNVEYYDNLFKRKGLSVNDIMNINDLRKIPLLNKETLREKEALFINKNYNKKKLLCIHTTGTTGTPLKVYCNSHVLQRNYAFYTRFLNLNNIKSEGRRATFGGRIIVSPQQSMPPFWRYSYFQKSLLFSSYHITDKNIKYYIEKLKKYRPDYIDTYPSSIFAIADFAQKTKYNLKGITKKITTSAETLYEEQRDIIENVFNVPVIDQYGSVEMCIFVGQCSKGNYHIHNDYGIVEFLKENGDKAEPGEEAEVVCTGFINNIMPLIRYKIGDKAVFSDRQCPCGSQFTVIEKIIGRMDDVIITPDGRKVGRLSPVLKGFPVKEAQYIQKKINLLEVRIVKGYGYTSDTDNSIIYELRKRLGKQINIRIVYVTQIYRGAGAKQKSIVSEI